MTSLKANNYASSTALLKNILSIYALLALILGKELLKAAEKLFTILLESEFNELQHPTT